MQTLRCRHRAFFNIVKIGLAGADAHGEALERQLWHRISALEPCMHILSLDSFKATAKSKLSFRVPYLRYHKLTKFKATALTCHRRSSPTLS